MHVNARSSNHVLDRNPKRLSECDLFSCEHSHRCIPVNPETSEIGTNGRFFSNRDTPEFPGYITIDKFKAKLGTNGKITHFLLFVLVNIGTILRDSWQV